MMRTLLAVLGLALLAGCAGPPPQSYAGPDAGMLVLSLSAATGPVGIKTYWLAMRRLDVAQTQPISLKWQPHAVNMTEPDPDSAGDPGSFEEADPVLDMLFLAPGRYAIYGAALAHVFPGQQAGVAQERMVLSFTIWPHRTTYLGHIVAHGYHPTRQDTGRASTSPLSLLPPNAFLAWFTLTDNALADIAAARRMYPDLPEVTDVVPEPKELRPPFLPSLKEWKT
jgi:hypothetical protein